MTEECKEEVRMDEEECIDGGELMEVLQQLASSGMLVMDVWPWVFELVSTAAT